MHKRELEKLLFQAVADALGVDTTSIIATKTKAAAPQRKQLAAQATDHRAAA